MQYCRKECNETGKELFSKSWGLADYYTKVDWSSVQYFGESTIRLGQLGYELRYEVIGSS